MTSDAWIRRTVKPLLLAVCLLPAGLLAWRAAAGGLGANPISELLHGTGDWTLRFVLLTLVITPLRGLSGWSAATRLRRMLGLFAFFYGCLHVLTYLVLDQGLDLAAILQDVVKRPYITAGLAGFAAMVPLALTSTQAMVRRLGGGAWTWLHRLVYLTAIAGVVHYWWLVKADLRQPQIYAALLALLLGYRVVAALRARGRAPASPASGR
jgi:methionine sulfoxide reductase heme-binding subunit